MNNLTNFFFINWIRQIVYIIIITAYLSLIFPNSKTRGIINTIMGIVISIAIVSPLVKNLSFDYTKVPEYFETVFNNVGKSTKMDLDLEDNNYEALIIDEYRNRITSQIIKLFEVDGKYKISNINIEFNNKDNFINIKSIHIEVFYLPDNSVSSIQPIVINPSNKNRDEEKSEISLICSAEIIESFKEKINGITGTDLSNIVIEMS